MQYCSGQNYGCRITEYTHRNITFLRLENDLLLVELTPDKGSDIVKFCYKPADVDFMWKLANIVDPAKHIPTTASTLGNNLDYYEGGWHESFPGGGPYTDYGYEQGLHGEAALLPWEYFVCEDKPDKIKILLRCRMVRTPFALEKTITLERGSAVLHFDEILYNLSEETLGFMWGHHPVFGKPFLDEGCVIDIPAEHFINSESFGSPYSRLADGEEGVWPRHTCKIGEVIDLSRIEPNSEKAAELLFVTPLEKGCYTIRNPRLGLGFEMSFDKELFPCVWYWKILNGLPGYPWYGMTYNIGIEFWTGYPNYYGAKKNGSLKFIGPNEIITTDYTAKIITDNSDNSDKANG